MVWQRIAQHRFKRRSSKPDEEAPKMQRGAQYTQAQSQRQRRDTNQPGA
jgi:hypothetical protein